MSSDMHEFLMYISSFFMVFLSLAVLCFCIRVFVWVYIEYWCPRPGSRGYEERRRRRAARERDRQGNIYTISDDNTLNTGPPRFADFFYLEPGSEEAARIRAQLEKDDKELPSYDEVMRMTSLPQSPTTGVESMPDCVAIPLGVSTTSIATTATDISIPAPPYTEVDVNATITAATAAATSTAIAGTPSTSRAAASMVVANEITTTTSTNA